MDPEVVRVIERRLRDMEHLCEDIRACYPAVAEAPRDSTGVQRLAVEPPPAESGEPPAIHDDERSVAEQRAPAIEPPPPRITVPSRAMLSPLPAVKPGISGARELIWSPPSLIKRILGDCAEHWKSLANHLRGRHQKEGLGTLLVCSSLPGEGASTIATCIACALAEDAATRVVLVDGDFGHGNLAHQLGVPSQHGLLELISGAARPEAVMVRLQPAQLGLLPMTGPAPAGTSPDHLAGLEILLSRLRDRVDLIVIDGGDLFSGESRGLPCHGVDAALMVRDPRKSGPQLLEWLDRHLAERQIASLGVIENFVD